MKLYHGSTIDIGRIDLAKSKPNKDFGRAFYLSADRQQALEMAQYRAEFEETAPVVNVYEFDETLFQQFRCKRFEEYTEEWAHFVYDHRPPPPPKHVSHSPALSRRQSQARSRIDVRKTPFVCRFWSAQMFCPH